MTTLAALFGVRKSNDEIQVCYKFTFLEVDVFYLSLLSFNQVEFWNKPDRSGWLTKQGLGLILPTY